MYYTTLTDRCEAPENAPTGLNSRTVSAVSKEFWSWSDTYGIDVGDGEDDVAILCTAVVIDLVCHNDKNDD